MAEKDLFQLTINPKFESLISPLTNDEFKQLEWNIKSDGCREPLVIWNGVIVDGHNRYRICTKNKIPFAIHNMQFENEQEVIAWICSNQLGRRNISEETRKYLIGKKYQAVKIITFSRNTNGSNQYSNNEQKSKIQEIHNDDDAMMRARTQPNCHKSAEKVANEYHLSHATVEKYGIYAKAVDTIAEKAPELTPKILSGEYRISHDNIVALSKKPPHEVKKFCAKMKTQSMSTVPTYRNTRPHIVSSHKQEYLQVEPSIKDMPEYDPDADITGLTLTLPSWISSIVRTKNNTKFDLISPEARNGLKSTLLELMEAVKNMLELLKEK